MKNKYLNLALCGASFIALASCSDYLDVSSVSTADGTFVFSNMTTARAAITGSYSSLHEVLRDNVFGNGHFYALDIAGSDIMRQPEAMGGQSSRNPAQTFYYGGDPAYVATYNPVNSSFKDADASTYSKLYAPIGSANIIISSLIESGYDPNDGTDITVSSQIYGEAVCIRATCYRELIKYYGDVPFQVTAGVKANGLASRDSIYDVLIAELEAVAPRMSAVTSTAKNQFSSTYAYALAGRMALEAAGYQLRRTDGSVNYIDGKGNKLTYEVLSSDNGLKAEYGRRSDYKDLYTKALADFKLAESNCGSVKFDADDYSTFFAQLHEDHTSRTYADESIFEDLYTQGAGSNNDERPYSLGRPSSGGGSNAYPCKDYGQGRVNPAFYYGMFDPSDKRRDIACCVTGSNGKGGEVILPMNPSSSGTTKGGGISCGKFDENRQTTVWIANNRRSGINQPYMRISEVYLGIAECDVVLGNAGEALTYFNKTYSRAMGKNYTGTLDLEKVIDERGFEFACEGDRRWTLIRTGLFGKKIDAIRSLSSAMVAGLKANGSYTFDNGNVISNSIYTKAVDPTTLGFTSRLMGVYTPKDGETAEQKAIAFPGWRGQHDWQNVSSTIYASDSKSNLAIQGLFEKVDGAALVAAGYTDQPWGSDIVKYEAEYTTYIMGGSNGVWNTSNVPLYLYPFTLTNRTAAGITNGYGFSNGTDY